MLRFFRNRSRTESLGFVCLKFVWMLEDAIWGFGPKNCKIDIFVAEFQFHALRVAHVARAENACGHSALS
jgi:hypothetical protein